MCGGLSNQTKCRSLSFLLSALLLILQAEAHGMHERSMHPREIASRQLAANKRHIKARNCAPEIAAYQHKRKMAKRSLLRARDFTPTTSALQPHETTIKNDTCVTAPEVTEGPYYINNDLIRQDVRENQGGILLELDIGVIDTSTCLPLADALVEIWHCNATGVYSGFTTASLGGFPGGPNGSFTFSIPSMTDTAFPSGAIPTDIPLGGGANKTDNTNFLRGGWPTNDQGIVTFNSVYPGFYVGRAVHIHLMVHQNITYNSNGTYTSHSGSLLHIGQMFFDDALNDQVMALAPYSSNTQARTYNNEDAILAQENSNGYNGYVDASLIGSDLSDGVLGFITVGVDSTAEYDIASFNYYNTGEVVEPVSPDSTTDISSPSSSIVTSTSSSVNGTALTRSFIRSTSTPTHQTHVSSTAPHPSDHGEHGPHGGEHGHDHGAW